MTRKLLSVLAALAAMATTVTMTVPASGAPLLQMSGAIFTTDATSSRVNLNHYASKEDVYLNGGPGSNAPVSAAGLPAGIYAFQVTDPSGKTLLSTDPVECRRVTIDDSGRFVDVTPSGACRHVTGIDGEDGGITVQLFPYDDTPNRGGVYKAWLTPYDALDSGAPGNKHGFVPGDSKTDNYKVRANNIVELDTRFHRDGALVDGLAATWTDTLGASNIKYSEWNPALLAFHEAHVEAVEQGTHFITVSDQDGCTIQSVSGPWGSKVTRSGGTYTVQIPVKNAQPGDNITYWVDVYCAS